MLSVLFLLSAAVVAQASSDAAPPGAPPAMPDTGKTSPARCAANYYPPIALRLNEEGTTQIDIEVTAQGDVRNVTVVRSSGFPALDAAAIVCVKGNWHYIPAMQNGKPVESHVRTNIVWVLRAGGGPPPQLPPSYAAPPAAPMGWLEDKSTEINGILASYKLTNSDAASNQFMSAGVYGGYSGLDDLMTRRGGAIERSKGATVITNTKINVCGGEPAWQIDYTRPWPVASNKDNALDVEQVGTVRNRIAYVSVYVRPVGAAKRPDAEQWIRSYCETGQ